MEQVVQPLLQGNRFMGTVLVARGEDVLFDKAHGYANLKWEVANSPATRFRIGSDRSWFCVLSSWFVFRFRFRVRRSEFDVLSSWFWLSCPTPGIHAGQSGGREDPGGGRRTGASYSARRMTTGSVRIARQTGRRAASAAASPSATVEARSDVQSIGSTP